MPHIDAEFIDSKFAWSLETFGPGDRLNGVLAHVRQELSEIEADPKDPVEWADAILLLMDGACRQGIAGAQLLEALVNKQAKNVRRKWPDWRTHTENEPIRHIKAAAEEIVPLAQAEPVVSMPAPTKNPPAFTARGVDMDGEFEFSAPTLEALGVRYRQTPHGGQPIQVFDAEGKYTKILLCRDGTWVLDYPGQIG